MAVFRYPRRTDNAVGERNHRALTSWLDVFTVQRDDDGAVVIDDLTILGNPQLPAVGCHVQRESALTIADSTNTNVLWNNTVRDEEDWHDIGGDKARITVQQNGWFILTSGIEWGGIVSGDRTRHIITVNGTDEAERDDVSSLSGPAYTVAKAMYLSIDDYVQVRVFHNGGTGVTITTSATSFFSVVRL